MQLSNYLTALAIFAGATASFAAPAPQERDSGLTDDNAASEVSLTAATGLSTEVPTDMPTGIPTAVYTAITAAASGYADEAFDGTDVNNKDSSAAGNWTDAGTPDVSGEFPDDSGTNGTTLSAPGNLTFGNATFGNFSLDNGESPAANGTVHVTSLPGANSTDTASDGAYSEMDSDDEQVDDDNDDNDEDEDEDDGSVADATS